CEMYQSIRPRHNVTLRAFYLDQHEVTNTQFHAFIQATQHTTQGEKNGKAFGYTDNPESWGEDIQGANWQRPEGMGSVFDSDRGSHPVVSVSWAEAQAYCEWSGKRLPTEAEWEYAARAGTDTQFWWGNDYPTLHKRGNFSDQAMQWKNLSLPIMGSYLDEYPRTAPIDSFEANPWGLHDMTGNVQEWVSDWYDKTYYRQSSKQNPSGPEHGRLKVIRGNSWTSQNLSLAERSPTLPTHISSDIGFRCAKDDSNQSIEQATDNGRTLQPSASETSTESEKEHSGKPIGSSVAEIPLKEDSASINKPSQPNMRLIPSGKIRQVAIDTFLIDQYEVSNNEFQKFVEATDYQTTAEQALGGDVFIGDRFENYFGVNWREPEGLWLFTPDEKTSVFDTGRAEHPVTLVSSKDAQAYCKWVRKRLPTDIEWEYALRAGSTTNFWWGDELPASQIIGNFADETHQQAFQQRKLVIVHDYRDQFARTAPIGSFIPNAWGLYDMAGNLAEWVLGTSDQEDHRVGIVRGGSWASEPKDLRSTTHKIYPLLTAKSDIGFRCAQDVR
ncbi:MAG: formylglycine-generating enzyme family protein, partial [Nitrospirales bacterium]